MPSPFRQPESPLSLTYPRSGRIRTEPKAVSDRRSSELDKQIRDHVGKVNEATYTQSLADMARDYTRMPAIERVVHDYTDPMFALAEIATKNTLPRSSEKFREFRQMQNREDEKNAQILASERSGDFPTAKEKIVNQTGAIAKQYMPGGVAYQVASEYAQTGSPAAAAFQGLISMIPGSTTIKSARPIFRKATIPGGVLTGRKTIKHEFASKVAEAQLSEEADRIRNQND